jgi:hypothetical protein
MGRRVAGGPCRTGRGCSSQHPSGPARQNASFSARLLSDIGRRLRVAGRRYRRRAQTSRLPALLAPLDLTGPAGWALPWRHGLAVTGRAASSFGSLVLETGAHSDPGVQLSRFCRLQAGALQQLYRPGRRRLRLGFSTPSPTSSSLTTPNGLTRFHPARAADGTSTGIRPRRRPASRWTPRPSLQWVMDTYHRTGHRPQRPDGPARGQPPRPGDALVPLRRQWCRSAGLRRLRLPR